MNEEYKLAMGYRDVLIAVIDIISGIKPELCSSFKEKLRELDTGKIPCSDIKNIREGEVDMVNHPSHYTQGKFEVIEVLEDWKCGVHDGNAIKYIARHKHKGKPVEDLKKAVWYLNRLISLYEKGGDNGK